MHPNDYAMYCVMLAAVLLPVAYWLNSLWLSFLCWFAVLLAVACEILTLSRSGLVNIFAVVMAATVYGVYWHRTVKNKLFILLALVAACLMLVKASDNLLERFFRQEIPITDALVYRQKMNDQAIAMAGDHPFGVGLGNYSAWSWVKYADVVDDYGVVKPGVTAHNIWFLTVAELGWIGLVIFTCMWLRIFHVLFGAIKAHAGSLEGAVLLGITLAILALHTGSLLHFSYRHITVSQLMHVMLGVAVGITVFSRKTVATVATVEKVQTTSSPSGFS